MKPLNKYYDLEEALSAVGAGWSSLIKKIYNAKEGMSIPVGIIMVKEKFGGLRIYTEYYVPEIENIIIQVGYESFNICEECGSPGKLGKNPSGLFKTRCQTHMENFVEIQNN